MLMIVYALNFIDRQLLVIVQESIKIELGLSDTELGLLTGFAFAMFYVSMGIPIARLSDKSNRKNIIAVCLGVWSGITALTGLAVNYFQLIIARIGVGIGEAGCAPQSHAIISDYYPVEKRGTALSVFSLGIYLGIFVAYLGGGILNQNYGWRITFFSMGLPGLLLAILLFFTIREPKRGVSDTKTQSNLELSFLEVIKFLFSKKTFVCLFLCVGFTAFVLYGIGNWLPSFLIRYYGLTSQEIGISNAFIIGIGGALGTYGGGFLADILGRKSRKWYVWLPMIAVTTSIPLAVFALLTSELKLAYVFIFLSVTCMAMYLAPSIAIAHTLVHANMRAVTSSLLFFGLNLIGLGGGPLMTGALSDLMKTDFGDQSLRYSMVCTVCVGLLAAFFFFLASRAMESELEVHETEP
jgi:MFS family permease